MNSSNARLPTLSKEAGAAALPEGWRYFRRLQSAALASAALAGTVYCILLAWNPPEPVPQAFTFDPSASWITTGAAHQATGCFRLELSIPRKVVNAWIAVAAHGGFEVLANGSSCAHFFVMRAPRPFQNGLSETGQRLSSSGAALSVRYPQYQWSDHDNSELPTWVDLTSVLHSGRNALCVEVESSDAMPALILSGEVLLDTGEKIPIRSGPEWAAEPVPRTLPQESWIDTQSRVLDWDHARVLPWNRRFWRLVPPEAYQEPFRGKRIRSIATDSVSWLQQDWNLTKQPLEAFLRVATDTPFQVWINGRLVQPVTNCHSALASGPWFVRNANSSTLNFELEALPERLNPDDVATLLPGQHYIMRRQGALVDRNGGAQVIGSVNDLEQAFAKNERLWIVFNREQAGARGSAIDWQYPAGRFQLYLRNNAHLVFRSYLWSVYLWDRNAGEYSSFREKPGNWFE